MIHRSTERFSTTVQNYIKYRPGYPQELVSFMEEQIGLGRDSKVADIGSGTGKLTEWFVKKGIQTFGVEPNAAMRSAAASLLEGFPAFVSVDGTAENTQLPSQSVDMIVAAQAFHWFDIQKFRAECLRILKPGGWVLLIWNKRVDERSPFMQAYNNFLETYSIDYNEINLRRIDQAEYQLFFGTSFYSKAEFDHYQHFDLDGVLGRYLSCSYAYQKDHPDYTKAMQELTRIYQNHRQENQVKMWYRTEVYFAKMNG